MDELRQDKNYAKYIEAIGWDTMQIDKSWIFYRDIPMLGKVVKIQRPRNIKVLSKPKLQNVCFTIVEPNDSEDVRYLKKHGFRLLKEPYIPSKTLMLNLDESLEQILGQMKKDARYSIRKSKDVKIVVYSDSVKFREQWVKAVNGKHYVPSLKYVESFLEAFGKNAFMLVAPDLHAGAIFAISGKRAYYWGAFTDKVGRECMYQYAIIWEAIKIAKKNGVKQFDFEGIDDSRFKLKGWQGFSHFKKSFGGYEVLYPGAFIKINYWFLIKRFGLPVLIVLSLLALL